LLLTRFYSSPSCCVSSSSTCTRRCHLQITFHFILLVLVLCVRVRLCSLKGWIISALSVRHCYSIVRALRSNFSWSWKKLIFPWVSELLFLISSWVSRNLNWVFSDKKKIISILWIILVTVWFHLIISIPWISTLSEARHGLLISKFQTSSSILVAIHTTFWNNAFINSRIKVEILSQRIALIIFRLWIWGRSSCINTTCSWLRSTVVISACCISMSLSQPSASQLWWSLTLSSEHGQHIVVCILRNSRNLIVILNSGFSWVSSLFLNRRLLGIKLHQKLSTILLNFTCRRSICLSSRLSLSCVCSSKS